MLSFVLPSAFQRVLSESRLHGVDQRIKSDGMNAGEAVLFDLLIFDALSA